jgi:serine phosphatase RsbU (regulator of sigma subunit)
MTTLVVLHDGEATPFDLSQDDTTLGRHPSCGIQLHSNMVSRKHAHVVREGSDYFVEDLGSGNGTFVNGQRIQERTKLGHDDRIKLGPVLLRFEAPKAPKAKTPATDAVTEAFTLQVTGDDESDGSSTIIGTRETVTGGFGMLDVQPEAKLKAVLEISRSLAGTVDLDKILPKILDTLFDVFPHADRGCILLKAGEAGGMIPAVQKHRRESEDSTVKLSKTILSKVLDDRAGILSADAANDSRFEASESISSLTIRSMMCVPMLDLDGNPIGVINIDTQNPLNQFKEDDLDLLLAVASQAALSYASAQLMVSHMQKIEQDNEMEIARNVQRALLPTTFPDVDGYEFYASYDSAKAVGGDYYDAFLLPNQKICLSFGDVAGKGVPGALIMSRMSSVVQSTMQHVHEVGEAITAINSHMCANAVEGRFVTYVLVILDLKTHELSLVNAGHMSPLIRKADGSVDEFDEETIGLPVGVMDEYPFEVVTRTIAPGETVVIVTDGVDEAMNPDGELYTKERVVKFVSAGTPKADELGKALLADVRKHANGRPQNDDITIMTFGRNAS